MAGAEFGWGGLDVIDCSTFPAAWILRVDGRDAAEPWRGRYSDEEGARAFVQAEGGLLRLFDRRLRGMGFPRSAAPSTGHVGLVRCERPWRLMGAVCVDPGFWATVAPEGGVMVSAARHVLAWEIACRKPSHS